MISNKNINFNQNTSKRWIFPIGIVFIILLAASLRLIHLDSQSLWSDEIFEAVNAKKDIFSIISMTDSRFRLVITHIFMLFGQSELFVRMPSAITGILAVGLTYLVGKKLFGEATGVIGAFLLSISAFHIQYSQEARSYAFTVVLTLLSLYCLLQALENNRLRDWIGFSIVSVLSFDNNIVNVSVFICEIFYAFLALFSKHDLFSSFNTFRLIIKERSPKRSLIGPGIFNHRVSRLIFSILLAIILFIPFSFGLLSYFSNIGAIIGGGTSISSYRAITFSLDFFNGLLAKLSGVTGFIQSLIIIIFLISLVSLFVQGNWKIAVLMITWMIVPFVFLYFVKTSTPRFNFRHLIFILPLFLLVLAKGITSVSRYIGDVVRRIRPSFFLPSQLIGAFIIVGIIGGASATSINAYYGFQKEDWRGVSSFLKERVRPGDAIIQLSLWPRDGIPYYIGDTITNTQILYLDIFDITKLYLHVPPNDIWWVFRTQGNEEPIQAEKIGQLKGLLGSGFEVFPFARVAVIHQESADTKVTGTLMLAAKLLKIESDFDLPEIQSNYTWAWYALGDAENIGEDLNHAIEFYRNGLAVGPQYVDGYMLLANILTKQSRFEEALSQYDQAIKVNPPYGPAQIQQLSMLRKMGRVEEANRGLKQSIDANGIAWYELSMSQLSNLLIEHHDVDAAIQELTESLENQRDSGKLHLYLGLAYISKYQVENDPTSNTLIKAELELTKAQELVPNDDDLRNAWSVLRQLKGQ